MRLGLSLQRALALLLLLCLPACTHAQNAPKPATPSAVVLRAARMFDPREGRIVGGAVVIVEGERVVAAGANLPAPAGARVYDLGDVTLLPGLIDAHTHITYHFDKTGRFGLTWDATADETLKYAEENARARGDGQVRPGRSDALAFDDDEGAAVHLTVAHVEHARGAKDDGGRRRRLRRVLRARAGGEG